MSASQLDIRLDTLPRYDKVVVSGRLDSDTAPQLEAAIVQHLRSKPRNVLIDFQHLDYISSAGLRVVTLALKTMRSYGGNLQLARMQPQVKKVFDIVRLVPVNQIFTSIEELDDYLDKMQKDELERLKQFGDGSTTA